MFIKKNITGILFAILMLPLVLWSQDRPEIRGGLDEEREPGSLEDNIIPKIQLWKISGYGAFQDSIKLDTLQDYFHLYNPVYKNVITATYLGNYATPYLNNDFFGRTSNTDFFFLRTREAYLLFPNDKRISLENLFVK